MRGGPSNAHSITTIRPLSRRWAIVSAPLPIDVQVGDRVRVEDPQALDRPLRRDVHVAAVAARRGADEEHPLPPDPGGELLVDLVEDLAHRADPTGRAPRISSATSSGPRPVTSTISTPGELAHPRELALGEVARAALHRLDVAGAAAPRSRAPCAPSSDAPAACGGADLVDRAGRDHRVDARVDPRVQRLALHDEPDEARRVARLGGPQLVRAPRRGLELAELEQLERADDPAAVARLDRPRPPTARAARELRVQRLRAAAVELGLPARADLVGRRRAQREVGERGAQVEAGAADHDRPRARRAAAPSISACASCGVLAGAEARVDRQDRDEAVLEARLLGRASATPVSVSRPR